MSRQPWAINEMVLIKLRTLLFLGAGCTLAAACSWGEASRFGPVTLTQASTTWETYEYTLTRFNTIDSGSFDGKTRQTHTFDTWILENEYLKVTLLPDFGGRILSMIYKPTGHEELYQNPVGVPYQIGTNVFFYNWLMVYGGIFPTFPEPEHGKTWLLPWDFEIVEQTDHSVTVAMSFTDDEPYDFAPSQYDLGSTGIRASFYVTLEAGRAALDTRVLLENPNSGAVAFEYWMNTTLAPGSVPQDPRTTDQAEIIAPVEMIKIPGYWENIAAQEKPAGLTDVYTFDNLRDFDQWADMGIAYAFPDMGSANFWGVINHENNEGIFRIADNSITPGLKIWTWGYPQTVDIDPYAGPQEARPYIELWAGVTREFWQRAEFPANQFIEIEETYSPSVGLSNVSHANRDFLVNMYVDEFGQVACEIFGLYPETAVQVSLTLDDVLLHESSLILDPISGNLISAPLPESNDNGTLRLKITDVTGKEIFSGFLILSGSE